MMKRLFAVLVSLGLFLMVFGGALQAKPRVFRVASQQPPGDLLIMALEKWANLVEEKTSGQIELEVYPSSQLGNQDEMIAGVQMGTLDFIATVTSVVGRIKGAEDWQVFLAPYAFRDFDHLHKFLESAVYASLVKKAETAAPIKIVGVVCDRTPRALTTKSKVVKTPADMRGLKIRVPQFESLLATFQAWGCNPQVMAFEELFSALQMGVVDGQDNGIDLVASNGFYEVQKYYMPLEHVYESNLVWANAGVWKSLTPDQQKALTDAAREAYAWSRVVFDQQTKQFEKKLADNGMVFVKVDKESFVKAARPVVDRLDGKLWTKGLYDEIQSIK